MTHVYYDDGKRPIVAHRASDERGTRTACGEKLPLKHGFGGGTDDGVEKLTRPGYMTPCPKCWQKGLFE